jgi:hypothetical protein
MRKSTFSETQIVEILKDAESGVPVAELLRKHGISKARFFKWRSKYGGTTVAARLNLPRRTTRRIPRRVRQPLIAPPALNATRALDFMGDALCDVRPSAASP